MQIIDGKKIAIELLDELKKKPVPQRELAAILVGSNGASLSFLKQKQKIAEQLRVDFRMYALKPDLGPDGLVSEVSRRAKSDSVGGVIVQLPLPDGFDRGPVLNAIPAEKDVDVLGEEAAGAFFEGRSRILPPAVETLKEVLIRMDYRLDDKQVAVVGLGFLVGKPISQWLNGKAKKIIPLDLGFDPDDLKEADLIVTGAGSAGLIKPYMLKRGAGVVDFGYSLKGENKADGSKISGDFDADAEEADELSFYTPTPGGTGPILVAKLFENFYKLNKKE